MITDMKPSFIDIVRFINKSTPDSLLKIEENSYYLLTHRTSIQTMVKTVKIECTMEQVILPT